MPINTEFPKNNCQSTVLGVKVDLVSKKALKPRIGKYILEEVIYI